MELSSSLVEQKKWNQKISELEKNTKICGLTPQSVVEHLLTNLFGMPIKKDYGTTPQSILSYANDLLDYTLLAFMMAYKVIKTTYKHFPSLQEFIEEINKVQLEVNRDFRDKEKEKEHYKSNDHNELWVSIRDKLLKLMNKDQKDYFLKSNLSFFGTRMNSENDVDFILVCNTDNYEEGRRLVASSNVHRIFNKQIKMKYEQISGYKSWFVLKVLHYEPNIGRYVVNAG